MNIFRSLRSSFLLLIVISSLGMAAGTSRFGWSHNWALIALVGIGVVGFILSFVAKKD
jgi:hypothetical protein